MTTGVGQGFASDLCAGCLDNSRGSGPSATPPCKQGRLGATRGFPARPARMNPLAVGKVAFSKSLFGVSASPPGISSRTLTEATADTHVQPPGGQRVDHLRQDFENGKHAGLASNTGRLRKVAPPFDSCACDTPGPHRFPHGSRLGRKVIPDPRCVGSAPVRRPTDFPIRAIVSSKAANAGARSDGRDIAAVDDELASENRAHRSDPTRSG